jgi:hypothetical protein
MVEPQNQGRGTSLRGLQWFTRKPLGYSVELQNRGRRPLPLGSFEAEDTCRDRKACVEAKQVAVTGHPSDEENLTTSKFSLEGLVSLVIK